VASIQTPPAAVQSLVGIKVCCVSVFANGQVNVNNQGQVLQTCIPGCPQSTLPTCPMAHMFHQNIQCSVHANATVQVSAQTGQH
jgi:hypothetical protein